MFLQDDLRAAIEAQRAELKNSILRLNENQQRLGSTVRHQAVRLQRIANVYRDPAADHRPQQRLAAEEQERRRIARELHDELGQSLALMQIGLETLKRGSQDPTIGERVQQLQQLAGELNAGLRNIAQRLRPPALDDLGLAAALEQLVERWSEQTGTPADYSFGARTELDPELQATIYRTIQEALTNVLKYAQAKRVSVAVTERPGVLTVIVEDDGKGFDPRALEWEARGLGLRGMQERLAALGGVLEIESAPGQGTTLYARVPVNQV